LVVIEAMACGTPVIAWRRGSVPEIVDHGVTGFIVENETQAIESISALDRLDRQNIRRVFEQRFSARRMAQEYLHCFENVARTAERSAQRRG
jgi:glycosyltransferase involved in cell wall biosynthesis